MKRMKKMKKMKSLMIILSVGNRCYTEIYLKGLGFKNFSSPFGSVYLKNVDNIIHLFKNKINYNNMIHT